jgi:four helix bundle protein
MKTTTFQVLEDAIELCRLVKTSADDIEKHDRKLAGQLRGAAQSAAANVAEGMHRRGGHQRERFGVAYGSAQEVKTHLRVAEAFGYVTERATAKSYDRADKLAASLWRCLHRRQ